MENSNANATLTLVLGANRIGVNKEKLAIESRYFESLFSHNFNDSRAEEHIINYEIDISTLQNFVDWIQDKESIEHNCHSIKSSMVKFLKNDFTDLLRLLQLSILFFVDSLTKDIIDIIVLCWLSPERVIDTWLLSRELSINVLRDICFSVCIERFDDLPVSSLIELPKENFEQIVSNSNIRTSIEHLHLVQSEWLQRNMTSDIVFVKEKVKPKFVQGLVVHRIDEFMAKDAYVYTWDGINLSECVQVKNLLKFGKSLIGMQVTGRGFSIFMVGGEFGLGTGHFNKDIWRYCLLSKKWYYQATLPVVRRHMVAVFLKNKLTIVGGIGRHRLKLYTVDVLDIHTGTWSRGAKLPENFTEVPPHCVMNGKLFLIKSCVYIYYPDHNHWETILIYNNPAVQKVDAFLTYDTSLFLTGNHLNETVLTRIDVSEDLVCDKDECLKRCTEHSIIKDIDVAHEGESYQLMYTQIADVGIMLLNDHQNSLKNTNLHLSTEIRSDLGNCCCNPRLGYFSLIQPHTLYDTVSS